jgi:hypothetical protein
MVTELAMNWRRLAMKWVRYKERSSEVDVKWGRPRIWRPGPSTSQSMAAKTRCQGMAAKKQLSNGLGPGFGVQGQLRARVRRSGPAKGQGLAAKNSYQMGVGPGFGVQGQLRARVWRPKIASIGGRPRVWRPGPAKGQGLAAKNSYQKGVGPGFGVQAS